MDKKKEGIYRKSKYESRLMHATGEIRPKVDFDPFHEDDYTQCVFGRWHNLGYSSGFRLMVYIQCCCVAVGHKEGFASCFFVGDLIERMGEVFPGVAPSAVRGAVGELRKGGFVMKTGIRGKYMINPAYAVNGRILESKYKAIKEKYSK